MTYKISNSRLDLYRTCARKFEIQYIENWEPDKTFLALLFGGAIDKSLNELLLMKKDKRINLKTVHTIFDAEMQKYRGENELVYFKNELPPGFESDDPQECQIAAFKNLIEVGHKMLDLYRTKILDQLGEILDVQIEKKITNADGDVFTMIVDFICKLPDGRICIMDNKTTSDLKKQYTEKTTHNSQQLNLYFQQFENTTHIGYVPMQKKLVKGEVIWDILISEPNPEACDKAYEELATTLDKIKAGEFPKNEKSCFLYGKLCSFNGYCKYGNKKGLKQREQIGQK